MLRITYVLWVFCLLASLLSACQPAPAPAPLPAATAIPPTATAAPPTATEPPPPTATTAPTPVAAAPTPRPTVAAPQMTLKTDQITSAALAGNLFGDPATRPFNVLLPPSYDTSEARYPVVYVLHWFGGDESTFVWKFKAAMDKLLAAGAVEEMILVFPNANNRLGGSMYLSSPAIGDYETYIAQELVGYVDANYRTLAQPDSRGITGCSMGGDGSIHLALKFPAVFSVAAPDSAAYDYSQDPTLPVAVADLRAEPADLDAIVENPFSHAIGWYAGAAAAAANPDNPPFYFDLPFTVVDGKGQVVQEVIDRIVATDPVHDLERYRQGTDRLRAVMLYHGEFDAYAPIEGARAFGERLAEAGVDYDLVEVMEAHCELDYAPILQFMSEHLVQE